MPGLAPPPADTPPAGDGLLEQLGINVIRGLAMDAPRAADSGHSGTAMALAPLAHVLWTRVMRHDPTDPAWPDRDRFVLSNGHASILLYSMLYLTGYDLALDDIKAFRQWGSRTPGHPERRHTAGVEVTTGPLGQGVGNGVGMGVAERILRARFGPELVDHHTFVLAGDGCFEEGISHEAASLAGHLGLGRLVYVYDDNHITIDGPTELSYTDNVPERFRAYGWDVDEVGEVANDTAALEAAVRRAMAVEDRPSLIVLRSHIGWPSPTLTDTNKAHGDPFPPDDIRATKEILGLPPDETFWVPDEVLDHYRRCVARGQALRAGWEARLASSGVDRAAWDAAWAGRGLDGWAAKLPTFEPGEEIATRKVVNTCITATAEVIPGLVAGAADLTGNTGMQLKDAETQSPEHPGGRQVYFGIREHGMGAVMTGMACHGGILPVGGTFFVFSDYMRGAVRLAALSRAHVVYSWTHDSVGLGQDGPTHQPIEHLASLRAMPGLSVVRPADANECTQAWRLAVDGDGPTALVLTRQPIPVLAETAERAPEGVARGGYVLVDEVGGTAGVGQGPHASEEPGVGAPGGSGGTAGVGQGPHASEEPGVGAPGGSGGTAGVGQGPHASEEPGVGAPGGSGCTAEVVLVSTGSEVHVCVAAATLLAGRGVRARVVSLPCWDRFEAQDEQYRRSVLPPGVPTLSVEAAASFGWARYADDSVAIDTFGASAPGEVALAELGFTPDNVVERAVALLAGRSAGR